MALVVVEKTLEQKSGRSQDKRTGTLVFYVSSDNGSNITTVAAEVASGIPAIGTSFPGDSTRKCISVDAEYLEEQRRDICKVTAEFETAPLTVVDDPLDADPIWWIETEVDEEEYYLDTASTKANLSNGKPITPRPKRKTVAYTLMIEKNVAPDYALSNFGTYNNRSNSDSITHSASGVSISAGQGHLIMRISKPQEQNGVQYRVLTRELSIKQEGYRQKYESRDKEQLSGISDDLIPILDPFGQPIDFPYPLQADGSRAGSVDAAPYEIELKPYSEVAMNTFLNS